MDDSRDPVAPRPSGTRREILFPPYRLDLDAERLYQGSEAIALRPKTFAVLRHLVEHPQTLVTKAALLDAIWTGVAVTESTLTKSIGEIREALHDDSHQPRYLETVHRRGFRFLCPTTSSFPPDATAHAAPRLPTVGRDEELARLHEALRLATAGERQVVFVTGAAGIGKTTLVTTFLAALDERDDPWIAIGQCVRQHGEHEPYMPVLMALAHLARGRHGERLRTLLRRHAPSWLVQLPWLATREELQELRPTLAGTTRVGMLRKFLHLVDELTTDTTLVLVLEDLHWADPSTLDLLAALAQREQRAALLVIGTYRLAESVREGGGMLDELRRSLAAKRLCHELPLRPLSPPDIEAYLTARFGRVAVPELARMLHHQTDGAPLFLVTAIEQLLATGLLVGGPPALTATTTLSVLEQSIPGSLRDLVESQVAASDPLEIAVLEAASVVGTAFAAAAAGAALEVDTVEIEEVCERLVRSHRFLTRADKAHTWPDGTATARYAFVHGLYQRHLYDRLAPARCELLHRRVGMRLEAAYGETGLAGGEIAVHFERGHEPARALKHLMHAVALAERRCAPRETGDYVRRALGLLEREPPTRQRHRRELALRSSLVAASVVFAGFSSDDGWANYLRARELAADERDATQLFQLLYAMFLSRIGRADAATAGTLADELRRAADRLDLSPARTIARFARSYLSFFSGRLGDAATLDEMRHCAPGALDGFFYGSNPVVVAGAAEGLRLWLLGQPTRAREVAEATIAQARRMPHPINLCMALSMAAQVFVRCGDLGRAEKQVTEGQALAEEYGIGLWGPLHVGTRGMIHARRNELRPAADALGSAIVELRANGTTIGIPLLASELGDVARRLGNVDEGLARVAEGLEATRDGLDFSMKVESWRARGELLLARAPDDGDGIECLARAIALARGDGAVAFELRAASVLAVVYRDHGRHADAVATLAPALARFREGRDTADVAHAESVMRTLGR